MGKEEKRNRLGMEEEGGEEKKRLREKESICVCVCVCGGTVYFTLKKELSISTLCQKRRKRKESLSVI